jgi:hypothetical protein
MLGLTGSAFGSKVGVGDSQTISVPGFTTGTPVARSQSSLRQPLATIQASRGGSIGTDWVFKA